MLTFFLLLFELVAKSSNCYKSVSYVCIHYCISLYKNVLYIILKTKYISAFLATFGIFQV